MSVRKERSEDGNLFHIPILFSLAVAWPLFEQMAESPEFFIVRGSGTADLILLAAVLLIFLPGALSLLVWVLKQFNHTLGNALQNLVLFVLFASLFLIPVNRTWNLPWSLQLLLCLMAAGLVILCYRKYQSIRTFIGFLAPAILVVPCIFFLNDSISKLILKKEISFPSIEIKSSTPIIFIVFDEFPLSSILKDQLTINEELYPNFAALTKEATWYRNATTVSDLTSYAVPAILTGKFPRELELPVVYDHPANLFTALGRNYDLTVFEDGERLLPAEFNKLKTVELNLAGRLNSILSDLSILYLHLILPGEIRGNLPPVDLAWGNFNVENHPKNDSALIHSAKFQAFIEKITTSNKPTLFYLHSMLPHAPWNFLPSGTFQRCKPVADVRGYKGILECHLLTVGYVDRLVGQLVAHLKKIGIYDQSLLIITSDHGAGFRSGPARRAARMNNYRDILLVPLFIKAPFQKQGEVSDLNVWLIDLMPTIGDTLGVQFSWAEGISVYDPAIKNRKTKKFFSGVTHEMMEFEPVIRANSETLAAQESFIQSNRFQLALKR